jgi:hypothetical protein
MSDLETEIKNFSLLDTESNKDVMGSSQVDLVRTSGKELQ